MPVKAENITDFCAQFARSEFREVHFKTDELEIFLSKDPGATRLSGLYLTHPEADGPVSTESENGAPEEFDVRAPVFGTLRLDGGDDETPLIRKDRWINTGEVVAHIEVLGERTLVKAERDGMIAKIHVQSGALVDFDATLFTFMASE